MRKAPPAGTMPKQAPPKQVPKRPEVKIDLVEIEQTITGIMKESQAHEQRAIAAEQQVAELKKELVASKEQYNVLVGFIDNFLTPAWKADDPKFEIKPTILEPAARRMAKEMVARSLTNPQLPRPTKPAPVQPPEPAVSEPPAEESPEEEQE